MGLKPRHRPPAPAPEPEPEPEPEPHSAHDHPLHGEWDAETVEWYIHEHGDHATNRLTVELADIRADDVVLDIGCGPGAAVRAAAARALRAIGVDPSEGMVRAAAQRSRTDPHADRIEFHRARAEALPFEDASVSVVLAINSLHHWADVDKGLEEVRRVLTRGGRLVLGDEDWQASDRDCDPGPLANPHVISRTLRRAGFANIVVRPHREGDVKMFLVAARR